VLEKNLKNGSIVANFLEVFVDDDEAILAQLSKTCGPNYNVFSHVKVPRIRIPMNVHVDVAPNVKRENVEAKGDGNDVQLIFDKGNNMRSKILSHFIKGKITLSPMEKKLIIFLVNWNI
jgi:hypothetical protein